MEQPHHWRTSTEVLLQQVREVRGERGARRLARVPRHGGHQLGGGVPVQLISAGRDARGSGEGGGGERA